MQFEEYPINTRDLMDLDWALRKPSTTSLIAHLSKCSRSKRSFEREIRWHYARIILKFLFFHCSWCCFWSKIEGLLHWVGICLRWGTSALIVSKDITKLKRCSTILMWNGQREIKGDWITNQWKCVIFTAKRWSFVVYRFEV